MTVNSESGKEDKIVARVRCFFDINLGLLPSGRIVFELFSDLAPKCAENFRSLCTGEQGLGITTGKNLHYKGCIFHRVVKDFMIQSGDFSSFNGTGGESIYGGVFDDEAFELKHDKPFLLSMANRGKNTNGSQFFITTQPAPHLDNVHIVFGCVVSGQDLVRQLEALPVDRNSRPLQDATIINCGELVRQAKVKKEKKKKRTVESDAENSDDSGNDEKKKKKDKKKKKEKKRNKSEEKINSAIEEEDLEEGEVHPLASITKIDPEDIPEVSNKFLMRKTPVKEVENKEKDKKDRPERRRDRERERERDRPAARNNFGWPKKRNPLSRSGRAVKGRGVFRYRTPSKSRSRSRSYTPPHWKQAQKRTIKLSDFEKNEEDKRKRDAEIKRRETERKKRHEEMARDSKKSFYELQQTDYNASKSDAGKDKNSNESEKEDGEIDGTTDTYPERGPRNRTKSGGSFDMNALDYEEHGSDKDDKMRDDKKTSKVNEKIASTIEVSKKSDSMALAFEIEVKSIDLPSKESTNKDSIPSKDYDKQEDDNNFRRVARKQSRDQNIREHRSRSRDRRPYRNNNRQVDWRGRFRGGSRRRDFNRGRFERNRKSRSFDRSRHRSPVHRRSQRDTRSRDRHRSASNQRSRDNSRARSKSNLKKDISKSRSKSVSPSREKRPVRQKSKEPVVEVPRVTLSEERARIQKEKMLKRAEAFLLFKSHMKKEIEEQEKKQQEKKQKEEREKNENAIELIRLEKLKKDTLEKIQAHEEIIQLEAVKRVLETVVSSVKEKDLARKLKRSRRDVSLSGSEDSDGKSKKKKKEKRKKSRRHSSSSSAY